MGYLAKLKWQLVFILSKGIGYIKTFKVKDKNNELMYLRINDEKLLKNIKLFGKRLKI